MKIIRKATKKDLEKFIYNINLEDPNLYKEINSPDSIGIFQISGGTAGKLCREVKPKNFNEIIAISAMARPGPLENSFSGYLQGKNGVLPDYPQKMLEILKETYGTIVFQEQVLEIFNKLGNFTIEEAEIVRNSMKKLSKAEKKEDDIKEWENIVKRFTAGCIKNNIKKEEAEKIANDVKAFSGYSFNKAHAVSYSYISALTLYFSFYFRKFFYCSHLIYEKLSDILPFISALKKYNIGLNPPDINKSEKTFSITGNNIIFGLSNIKQVGPAAINKIIEERKNGEYKSLFDFYKRTKCRAITKKTIEKLIKIGAFDEIEKMDRKKILSIFLNFIEKYKNTKRAPDIPYQEAYEKYKHSMPATLNELIEYEKECLEHNFFYTKFNDEKVKEKIKKIKEINNYNLVFSETFKEMELENPKKIPVIISNTWEYNDKNNNKMLFLSCYDKDMNFINKLPLFHHIYRNINIEIEKDEVYLLFLEKKNENNFVFYNNWEYIKSKKNILIKKLS